MPGYSGTPLWKKLGYTDGLIAYVENSYTGYKADLQLPRDVQVSWAKQPGKEIAFVHLFVTERQALTKRLKMLRGTLTPAGVIWVSWPKKSSGVATDLSEDIVRELALPLGVVDIKVCAVNDVWSGLKLVIRKALR